MSSRATIKLNKQTSHTTIPVRGLTSQRRFAHLRHVDEEPTSDRESADTLLDRGLSYDFGQIRVHPDVVEESYPLATNPRFSPFGGACHSCPPRVQAKLTINEPGDKYEQEADRAAEQVMHTPKPQMQRKGCFSCKGTDEEEQIQTKPIAGRVTPLIQREVEEQGDDENPSLQYKEVPGQTPGVTKEVQKDINNLRGTGKPLPKSERSVFEQRFGHDFSQVRVHTGSQAARLAHAVNAKAFTVDRDVVFGPGQYAPETNVGQRLLAHELTHVVQQSDHRNVPNLQRHTIDASCRSAKEFPAEQRGNAQCQDKTTIPNGTVYNLSFATLPNRCPKDKYSKHSPELIELALKKIGQVISSPDRSKRHRQCLKEEEFQRGVLKILENTTVKCEPDRSGPAFASVMSNIVHLRHGDIHGADSWDWAIEFLAGKIFHELLHVWEGRILASHIGIVTPCTAACFPRSGQAMVNTNPEDCVMPPLVRKNIVSVGPRAEATRGGGLGVALSYRRTLFTALRGHLAGQAGVDVSYNRLFSSESQKRFGKDLLQITPSIGLGVRPGILDRKGLIFNLDVGPSLETGFQERIRPGIRVNLEAGLEYDFLQFGAGIGAVVPLSDDSEKILDFMVNAKLTF